jgi:hypothetical protein
MRELSLNIEHSSDVTFDQHWSRIVYLISSTLFAGMGVICVQYIHYTSLSSEFKSILNMFKYSDVTLNGNR